MMQRLSVTIVAGAEEQNIKDCLESVKWADEIIVVSDSSKDHTIDIAREYTQKVISKKWEGYATQKQFALQKASNPWVLSLDADERVSPELKEEICQVLKNDQGYNGYYIPRKNFFLGHWVKHCGWYPGYQLRLFRKEKTRMNERKVHEAFVVNGNVGYLRNDLLHYTHSTISATLKKINEYSTLEAEEKVDRIKANGFHLVFVPLAEFIKFFILKKGFLDGVYGLMVSVIHAMTKSQTYLKIWEQQHQRREFKSFY